ncbi:ParB N-terminal domain-containing protein [Burkholderia cenocepacia]|uniref:ParB/RepB/Spo0J family partition protein n=1 Tax=Burkholderia cenocepacia TaxID=95486 RepID=UPI001B91D3CB|nr:ParB N-terminal domain-containing protein [Burkholderia cenocepacia]MBR8043155.1 ParB N-terminal domain-containing protein [Burkholderia cenocepacia]MBR8324475.1 ParB N-terminal domain-containing protein [Burkholderia cenocepacia]
MTKLNKFQERMAAKTQGVAQRAEAAAAARADGSARPIATMPGQLGAFRLEAQEYQRRIDALEAQLADAMRSGGQGLDIPVDKLHEVPGRRRYMAPEKYAELRENLKHNKLINPVVVLPRADGEWDVWSGHHRWDAHKDNGKPTVRCVLGNVESEIEAADGAFIANLMQSDLTDFEKYQGIKNYQSNHPDFSQTEIAENLGLAKQQVNLLLAFDRLPADALAVVDLHKAILGATAAGDLATLTESGKAARVVEAVKLLAEGKFDQARAVKYAGASDEKLKQVAQAESFKIKTGRAVWCDVRRAKNVMRIEFKTEAQAEAAQEAIRLHLESLAKADTSETSDSNS